MGRVDKVMSWNMGCSKYAKTDTRRESRLLAILRGLIEEQDAALIALQEAPSETAMTIALGKDYSLRRTVEGVAIAYDTRRWYCDQEYSSSGRVLMLGLCPLGASHSLWMCSAHVPTMYKDAVQKREFVRTEIVAKLRICRAIDQERENVVAGDLNVPPFDEVILSGDGLRSNRSLRWVSDRASGIDRSLFNATWAILGRHDDACGTLYRSDVGHDGPWYAVDQIMMSARLVGSAHDAKVIDRVSGNRLRNSGPVGMPNRKVGSDHLPIVSTIYVG